MFQDIHTIQTVKNIMCTFFFFSCGMLHTKINQSRHGTYSKYVIRVFIYNSYRFSICRSFFKNVCKSFENSWTWVIYFPSYSYNTFILPLHFLNSFSKPYISLQFNRRILKKNRKLKKKWFKPFRSFSLATLYLETGRKCYTETAAIAVFLVQCFKNFSVQINNLGPGQNADSDLLGPGWELTFSISNKLPGDGDAVGPPATFCVARL